MSDRFGLMQLESIQNRYLDGNRVLQCSDETATLIDEEVKALLAECYEKSKKILSEHLDTIDKIAEFLIEKETITGKEFMKIYREVENIPEPTEEEAEEAKRKRIYSTRPESAKIGENIPLRENKKKSDDSDASKKEAEKAETIEAPKEAQEQQSAASEEKPEENSATASEDNNAGGRFSHVPDNFDNM